MSIGLRTDPSLLAVSLQVT